MRTTALAFAILLTACSHGTTSYEQVEASKILMGAVVNEEQEITEEQSVFSPSDETIHVHALVEGLLEETEVMASWWYGEIPEEEKIYETRVKATPELPVAKFFLKNVRGWPVGSYRFSISVDGKEVGGKGFTVEE